MHTRARACPWVCLRLRACVWQTDRGDHRGIAGVPSHRRPSLVGRAIGRRVGHAVKPRRNASRSYVSLHGRTLPLAWPVLQRGGAPGRVQHPPHGAQPPGLGQEAELGEALRAARHGPARTRVRGAVSRTDGRVERLCPREGTSVLGVQHWTLRARGGLQRRLPQGATDRPHSPSSVLVLPSTAPRCGLRNVRPSSSRSSLPVSRPLSSIHVHQRGPMRL